MVKVFISPTAEQVRDTDGIGRIVKAQYKHLSSYGIELVARWEDAEVIASHITQNGLPRIDIQHNHGIYYNDIPHAPYSEWNYRVNTDIAEAARCAYAVTVPSEWVSKTFRRDMRINPYIIGHGIDLAEWRDIEKINKHYILWNKGRASVDVCDPKPIWELARRGYKCISTFAPERKIIPNTLSMTGMIPHEEMKRFIAECEIYLATTIETFGIGTLEGLACGKPVLGFNWGGTKDIVTHRYNGYLVEPDDIQGLCDGIEYIRAHYVEMSEAAFESVLDYDWSEIMPRYAKLYRDVAEYKAQEKHGVSVVITTYNYAKYIGEAIRSVLDQSYPADEIIIVDDGSTDNSLEVISQFEQYPQVKVIAQKNTGVAGARTAGISAASNPYITCLDADDKLAPTFIQNLQKALKEDRGLGIAYSGLMLMRGDGQKVPVYDWPPEFNWFQQSDPHVPPNNCIPSACMFRKEMWERAGGHKQVYAPGEDTEFWTRGLSIGFRAKRVTNEPLFWYRWHKDSASNTKPYVAIDTWLPWMKDKDYPFGSPVTEVKFVRSYAFPVVSVIIPIGPGHEKYLSSALDSLLGQTLRDWEVIVVNDTGTPVNDWQIAPKLTGVYPFVTWIETTGKCGAGYARNVGVSYATAPLLCFLDADDYLLSHALELMVKQYTEAGGRYIYTDWMAVDENKKITREQSADYSAVEMFYKLLHPITVVMAASDFHDIGGFDETLTGWEDWDFFIKCAVNGKHGYRLSEPLLVYYTHTGARRSNAFANSDTISSELKKRYEKYITGEKQMSACCGGNSPSILQAKRALGLVAREQQTGETVQKSIDVSSAQVGGKVRMEFIGEHKGSVAYLKGKYKAGNNPLHKYIDVDPEDVTKLEMTMNFKRVMRPEAVPQIEARPQFEERVFVEPAPPENIEVEAEEQIEVTETVEEDPPVEVEKKPVKPTMTIAQLAKAIKENGTKERLLYWYEEEKKLDTPRKIAMEMLEKAINKLLG